MSSAFSSGQACSMSQTTGHKGAHRALCEIAEKWVPGTESGETWATAQTRGIIPLQPPTPSLFSHLSAASADRYSLSPSVAFYVGQK